ncbi:MAG TPA: condensation domain-containing protein, partial [Pirellulales bacterium]
ILTTSQLSTRLPTHAAEVIDLDRAADEFDRYPATPLPAVSPDALAYIIYTSGSSGKPKGVEVTRAALANLVESMAETYMLSAGDRVLQIISPAFDVAAEEIYPTLVRGGTLVLGPPTTELTGRAILDICRRERVSVAHVPPQLWQQCLLEWRADDESLFDHLRVLVHGGEALSAEAITRWLRMARGRVKTLLEFGLTETTVTNLVYELPADLDMWPAKRKLPLGRPIAQSEVLLLDEHQQPLPPGAPGELYLGGPGVARGYHRLPEATQERFVSISRRVGKAHHEPPNAGSRDDFGGTMRFCRTGDLARWLPDGNLEFLGRIDTQIKLRGLRIEPGEIERVLATHPSVGEAAVVVREDVPGVRRLVAYLVPVKGAAIDGGELRAWLRGKLSDSMAPVAFVPLDRLPLNRSHKLDRDALPPPPAQGDARSYTAPRNEAERILAGVWQAVLKVDRIGIHDNFFELGGDSILTIQVVARAREAGLRFTPRQLFEHQTIADLAAVEGADASAAEQGLVMGDVALTPIQHWFLHPDVIDPHHFNQAVLLCVRPALAPDHLPGVFARLLEQHDALRLRFVLERGQWRQFHASEATWPVELVDLSKLPPDEQPSTLTAAAERIQTGLNLERGPLARAAWFELGAEQTRLLMVVHHLVIDAVSWRVLLDDMTRLWQQLADGQAAALPPKTSSFKQWADRLADYAGSAQLESELAFWQKLADRPPAPLPQDAAGENRQGAAETVTSEWPPGETSTLLNEANEPYRTQTNELLLAAVGQTLGLWAGGEVAIDVEGHGRADLFDDIDLSRTVGWFTAWRPHLTPPADLPPGALLRQTKETLRAAPHQGLSFGLLSYLSPKAEIRRRMVALPKAEVCFNYLGRMDDYLSSELLTPADEAVGAMRGARASRNHKIEINAYVRDGSLRIDWTFCRNLHRRETIERLAAKFRDRLAALVEHCLSPEAGGFTPSDFPLARLKEDELERLSKLLGD